MPRDGSLVWRFRGGPSDRKLLGNERLISTWPARGAPVIDDGTIYFAAGIWPFMGIFLHALDAETGEVRLDQRRRRLDLHQAAAQHRLVCRRRAARAAGRDRRQAAGSWRPFGAGVLRPARPASCSITSWPRTASVAAVRRCRRSISCFFNGGAAFDLSTEKYLGDVGEQHTFADGRLYDFRDGELCECSIWRRPMSSWSRPSIARERRAKKPSGRVREVNKVDTPQLTALIKAGSRLYAGTARTIVGV